MKLLESTPRILYKYRDWNDKHHKDILYKQEIYLPSASKFNDPFEGNFPFAYDESELTPDKIFLEMLSLARFEYPDWNDGKLHEFAYESQRKDFVHDPKHLELYRADVKDSIEKTFGIFCLTTNCNNFLMWSHYSNSHTGLCFGFDSNILFDSLQCIIGKVNYQDLIPTFKFSEPIEIFTEKLLGTKGKIWEYENEYRIIKSQSANRAFTIPIEGIVEIILGCKMDFLEKTKIIEFVKKNNLKCKIYDTKQSDTKFELIKHVIY
jgi:hypothetical protein